MLHSVYACCFVHRRDQTTENERDTHTHAKTLEKDTVERQMTIIECIRCKCVYSVCMWRADRKTVVSLNYKNITRSRVSHAVYITLSFTDTHTHTNTHKQTTTRTYSFAHATGISKHIHTHTHILFRVRTAHARRARARLAAQIIMLFAHAWPLVASHRAHEVMLMTRRCVRARDRQINMHCSAADSQPATICVAVAFVRRCLLLRLSRQRDCQIRRQQANAYASYASRDATKTANATPTTAELACPKATIILQYQRPKRNIKCRTLRKTHGVSVCLFYLHACPYTLLTKPWVNPIHKLKYTRVCCFRYLRRRDVENDNDTR